MALTPIDAAMGGAVQRAVNDAVSLRFGTVIAVNLGASTVEVELGDTTVKNVPLMEGANPTVGGTAWLLYQGSLLVCIGPGTTSSGGGGGGVPAGSVQAFAGSTLPTDWLWCDGGVYDTGTYPALFSAIGYAYGGSGTSFNVPDLRDRSVVGAGASISLGESGGKTTINSVVAHSHAMSGTVTVGGAGALGVSGTAVSVAGHDHLLNTATLSHTHTAPAHTHTISGTAASAGDHSHGLSSIGKNTNTQTGGSNQRLIDGGTSAGLRTNTLGSHSHGVSGTAASGGGSATTGPSGWGAPATQANGSHWHSLSGSTSTHGHSASHNLSAASTGDANVDIRNPYLGLNYMIKAA